MDFYRVVDEVLGLLRTRERMSYGAIKRQFALDEDVLDALKEELRYRHVHTVTVDDRGLVWTGVPAAERRHLTVLFCDLVDSTPLAGRLDPETFSEIVQVYQDSCEQVVRHYEGHVAAYLGDGLLVLFGFPSAHEDDAHRAVRASLDILDAITQLNVDLVRQYGFSIQVRVGCHTGVVVVGAFGGDARREDLALGETPNIAARIQGVAAPNTVAISAATHRLLDGLFACESLGAPPLKGVAQPLEVYRVVSDTTARNRLDAAGRTGLTELVGREAEVNFLRDRWAEALAGRGQVVMLTGEAGIGKSRLVRVLVEQAADAQAWFTLCQCSPFYQHTALYPVIDVLERVALRFGRADSAQQRLTKLREFLRENGQLQAEPLYASLLSLVPRDRDARPDLSPEEEKQQILQHLVDLVLARAAKQPVLFVVEDLQWIDPTTLTLLTMLVDGVPEARAMLLLTSRPDFALTGTADVHEMVLQRLTRDAAAELSARVAHENALPPGALDQIVMKTDGIPLFVEELTKMVLESGVLADAIPDTLQDSLAARLDRLGPDKSLAQLGAMLGREFSYPVICAVAGRDDAELQRGLNRLVTAEFLHQHGDPPTTTYRFKHALIQDAAYQSLLKRTRRHHHRRIAEVLESEFADIVSTQPELLAHHYTEAGLTLAALPYWRSAGERALQRFANDEAAAHLQRALTVLSTVPDDDDRARQELPLQIMLGAALAATKGQSTMEPVYGRACALARRVGTPDELFAALWGYCYAQLSQGRTAKARALAEDYLDLARQKGDSVVVTTGHRMVANSAWCQGELLTALDHSRHGLAAHEDGETPMAAYGQDSSVVCGVQEALALAELGYPEQAVRGMDTTLARARSMEHPFTVGQTLHFSALLRQVNREPAIALAHAEEALAICTQHGFGMYATWCLLPRGWALTQHGRVADGITDIRRGLDARKAAHAYGHLPWFLTVLADARAAIGEVEQGLADLREALWWADHNDEHHYDAESHRLIGELSLRGENWPRAEQALLTALDVARRQRAKLWELRAAVSMSRLRARQGRLAEGRQLVESTLAWFTEGFATADLRDAKAVVDSH